MALGAIEGLRTATLVVQDYLVILPSFTWGVIIHVFVGASAEVLPIVCIDTERFVVLREVERTPDCLIVEHVEVVVEVIVMDQVDHDLMLAMREGTVVKVFAVVGVVREKGTELGLVFVWVVEHLDDVMAPGTQIALGTFEVLLAELAEVRGVGHAGSSFILKVVIVATCLVVVGV